MNIQPSKEHRMFGAPGCGKTTALTKEIKKASKEFGSGQIFAASFTRTAAEELVGRNLTIDKHQVSTLHGHCYHALGQPDLADSKAFSEAVPEFAISTEQKANNMDENAIDAQHNTEGDELFAEYQVLRNKMIPREQWGIKVTNFAKAWEDFKKETDTIDFTDMIDLGIRDIDEAPNKPQVGFFDETQDFTLLELSLIRKWGKKMDKFYLSGDDDQAIYNFKGADSSAFLSGIIPDANIRILDQSYRVPRKVQQMALHWIKQVSKRQPKEYKPKQGAEGSIDRLRYNYKQADYIIEDAQKHLEAGKKVMFLTSCSHMLYPIVKALRENGIPFHNPYRKSRGDWNPLRRTGKGTSATERLMSFLLPSREHCGEAAKMWNREELFRWVEPLQAKGLLKSGAKTKIKQYMDTLEHDLSIDQLIDYLEDDALIQAMDHNVDWLFDNLMKSRKKSFEFPMRILKERGFVDLIREPLVTVGTIHSVKGGEADVVYLFPDISKKSVQQWHTYGDDRDSIIRQFYVGATRTKEKLILCSSASRYFVDMQYFA